MPITSLLGTVRVENLPVSQPVSVSNFPATQSVTGIVDVGNIPITQSIIGTVAIDNFPITQPVNGTVTSTQGTTPWICALVDGQKATYSAGVTNVASAAAATDIFTITGSATKVVRVLHIAVTGTRTSAGSNDVRLLLRASANTGGAPETVTSAPHDSASSAATALVQAYSTNPTLGFQVAVIRSQYQFLNTMSGNGICDNIKWDFGNDPGQAIVLRGNSQVLAINLGNTTIPGGLYQFWVTWTEEAL